MFRMIHSNQDKNTNEKSIQTLLQQLITKIYDHLSNFEKKSAEQSRTLQHKILIGMLLHLEKCKDNETSPEILLDFYCAANDIFRAVSESQNETAARQAIDLFFRIREDILCDDSHDYSYSLTFANQFCLWLAQQLYPNTKPINTVLRNATTSNRVTPWQHPYTMENELPDANQFFRTKHNQIHLYEGIVERACAELKSGFKDKSHIWLKTDIKPINSTEHKENKIALTEEDITILKQRTPSLKRLIDYTATLDVTMNETKLPLFERFFRLKVNLANGASRGNATSSSHEGIAKFANWWNQLNPKTQSVIKQVDYNLTEFIDDLLTKRDYCTEMASKRLYAILELEPVRLALNKIDGTIEYRIGNRELDVWKSDIINELKTHYPINTKQNFFLTLSQSELFPVFYKYHANMDLQVLKIFSQMLSSPRDIHAKRKIAEEIFTLQDPKKIAALYNVYTDMKLDTDDIFYFMLLIQCHIHNLLPKNLLSGSIYSEEINPQNILSELLYYTVYWNRLDIAKQLLKLDADPTHAGYLFQLQFLDIGFKCDIRSKLSNKWYKATITDRQGDLVNVHYDDWSSAWDEWISFTEHSKRFAKYNTLSRGVANDALLINVQKNDNYLFEIAYQRNQVEMAILLTEKQSFQPDIFLTARTDQQWQFILNYFNKLKIHHFNPKFIQTLLDYAITCNRTEMITLLESLGGQLQLEHMTLAMKTQNVTIARRLTQSLGFLDEFQQLMMEAKTDDQWQFVRNYLNNMHNQLPAPFIMKLFLRAILMHSHQTVEHLLKLGLNATDDHLKMAFAVDDSNLVTLLLTNKTLVNEELLLSAANNNQWLCVLAYISSRKVSEQTFYHLMRQVIKINNPSLLNSLVELGMPESAMLLLAKTENNWLFIKKYLDYINHKAYIKPNQIRPVAIDFAHHLIAREQNPVKLVAWLDTLFNLEMTNPLIIKKTSYMPNISGYQWKHTPVSEEWVEIIEKAKHKIIEIQKTTSQSLPTDVLEFLQSPTKNWAANFFNNVPLPTIPLVKTTPSITEAKRI